MGALNSHAKRYLHGSVVGLATASLVFAGFVFAVSLTSSAQAKDIPPKLDPLLSLRGDCTESSIDPVKDPSCPYLPPPEGPKPFERSTGIAVDPYGNEYIASMGAAAPGSETDERIDVFDDEGKFITELSLVPSNLILEFVGSIAVDSKGNIYTYSNVSGDVQLYSPSEYEPEAREIEYADAPVTVSTGGPSGAVAVDASNDHLFVVRQGTITEYGSANEGNDIVESFDSGVGPWSEKLAVDGQGRRLFVTGCGNVSNECFVRVLDADAHTMLEDIDGSSTPVGEFATGSGRLSIGIDEETGRFFIADPIAKAVYEFKADFGYRSQLASNLLQSGGTIAVSNGENASGDAFNRHYLFATTFENHRALAFAPTDLASPDVTPSVSAISESEATLEAEIDPGGADTEYSFELTTQAAFDSEGFAGAQIAGKGTVTGTSLPKKVSAPVAGLTPGTAYRFRVLAENEAGPAEPAAEAGFTTYDDAPGTGDCPNQALRTGASAALPDCRAYELVTPPDTNGRAPRGGSTTGFVGFSGVLTSPAGDATSFVIQGGSLPGTSGVGSVNGEMNRSTRGPSGWSTALASPSGDEVTQMLPGSTSPDQGYMVWRALGEGPLFIAGQSFVHYLHYPDGHSEPIGRGSEGIEPRAVTKLITEDAAHVVFESWNLGLNKAVKLEPNAPPEGIVAVYDRTIDPLTGAEQTHVVSLLPGDVTPSEDADYRGASRDGDGIAFAIGNALYLRKDNAVTYEIGEAVTFAGVSVGGERIFYLEEGDLKAFDTASETVIDFSESGDVTPVNVSSGGARAYFASPSVLAGANPEGELPIDGEQNLYLSEEGQVSFVGTVTDRDVEGLSGEDGLGLWTSALSFRPAIDPSRANPDGSVLLFQSRANLTGYDSAGAPQVYRYDSGAGRLDCVSCPTASAPAGAGAAIQSYAAGLADSVPSEANVVVPALTPDGRRAFFESTEALVSSDTDGKRDVYEWEEEGVGSCKRAGGCVYLISSGHSARDEYLYGHSTDGDDVFFTSGDRLSEEDASATASIYDARVGGGFATEAIAGECLGEACQPAVSAPGDPIPVLRGQGNPKPEPGKDRCPKPKRKVRKGGKTRCVKPKRSARQRHRKAAKQRRTAR